MIQPSSNAERLVRYSEVQIMRVTRVVTTCNSGCTCKFKMIDEYGEYEDTKPHSNWVLYTQDHDNEGFRYYLECIGCRYQLAKKYWDVDYSGGHIDYLEGRAKNSPYSQ